jgi:hypothetical protein
LIYFKSKKKNLFNNKLIFNKNLIKKISTENNIKKEKGKFFQSKLFHDPLLKSKKRAF